MPHQVLQRGQGDAGANHIGAEGVAEPMWVGVRDATASPMMPEQRAESGESHGPSALSAFQGNEQRGRVSERPFQPQIFVEHLDDFRGQWQNALLVSFAEDTHLRVGQLQIVELKGEDLRGAQAIKQHQADQGEIAKGAKAAPEFCDIVGRERYDDALGLP